MEYFIAWATLIGGITAFFSYSSKVINEDIKKNWGRVLADFVSTDLAQIIKWSCRQYILLFDSIYSNRNPSFVNQLGWMYIIFAVSAGFVLSATISLLYDVIVPLWRVLLFGSVFGIFISFFMGTSKILRDIKKYGRLLDNIFLILFQLLQLKCLHNNIKYKYN